MNLKLVRKFGKNNPQLPIFSLDQVALILQPIDINENVKPPVGQSAVKNCLAISDTPSDGKRVPIIAPTVEASTPRR